MPNGPTSVEATVNAFSQYTRETIWTISKIASPTEWNIFKGDSATSEYLISVIKEGFADTAKINGQICVRNTGENPTENLSITVALEWRLPGETDFTTIVQPQLVDVSAQPILYPVPGSPTEPNSFCYDYSVTIPSNFIDTTATYRVVAKITITNHPGGTDGPTTRATTTLPSTPVPIHNSITVTDTNGETYSNITDSTTFSYSRTYTCGTYTNTASITYEDDLTSGPSAEATVTVNCYDLWVSKTANTVYTRTYSWTIDKKISEDNTNFGDQANFVLAIGESHPAYYRLWVTPTASDHSFMVSGTISVYNPAPIAATVNDVTDFISGFGDVPVTCEGITFPYTLASGAMFSCSYSAELPDTSGAINYGTAVLQNYNYSLVNSQIVTQPIGISYFTAEAPIVFNTDPSFVEDRCISISDTLVPGTNQADALDSSTHVINYTGVVGPYQTCGNYTVVNTAEFITVACDTSTATGATGSDTATANISVPCNGCTHTIGFWKTHAGGVGNNPDLVTELLPQWLGTPGGAKSIQVTTAAQAIQLLSFSGEAFNGINKLYAQLLAAKLNIAYGADGTVVSSIISSADAYLATHNAADWNSLSRPQKNIINSWATTLDNYNNGLLGVPHCSESGEPIETIMPENEVEQEESWGYSVRININNSSNFRIVVGTNKEYNK
jgi:hypothetical protein